MGYDDIELDKSAQASRERQTEEDRIIEQIHDNWLDETIIRDCIEEFVHSDGSDEALSYFGELMRDKDYITASKLLLGHVTMQARKYAVRQVNDER